MRYSGPPPSKKWYQRDEDGRQRLPQSERGPGLDGLPGHGKLQHSTSVTVAHASRSGNNAHTAGDTMRRINNMFTNVAASEMPQAARKGKAAKDYSADPMYVALKAQPVAENSWFSDGKEYSEDQGRKLQSKIALYAKAGAGTFKTSFRQGKVYIAKTHAEYTKQRGE
jgi:hypothetical protein